MKSIKGLLVLVLVVVGFSANAQFKFGAATGLNFAKFSNNKVSTFSNILGFNAGLIFEIKLPIEFGIEADVLYSVKGSSFHPNLGNGIVSSDYSLKYIDIPVVAKLYLLKVTNLQLGVQYSHLIGADVKVEGFGSEDVKHQFNAGDIAAVFGFGIDVNKLHFSTRYNLGLVGALKGGDTKNNMLTFSVGIWLKK